MSVKKALTGLETLHFQKIICIFLKISPRILKHIPKKKRGKKKEKRWDMKIIAYAELAVFLLDTLD